MRCVPANLHDGSLICNLPMGKDLPAWAPRALHAPALWLARLRMPAWRIATRLIGAMPSGGLEECYMWQHSITQQCTWLSNSTQLLPCIYAQAEPVLRHMCSESFRVRSTIIRILYDYDCVPCLQYTKQYSARLFEKAQLPALPTAS